MIIFTVPTLPSRLIVSFAETSKIFSCALTSFPKAEHHNLIILPETVGVEGQLGTKWLLRSVILPADKPV